MTDEARERISALERFSAIGSGFTSRRSTSRSAAPATCSAGAERPVAAVGFDMYCQMLEEAVAGASRTSVTRDVDPELTFDVAGFLPDDYVAETGVRLSLYKRLADALSRTRCTESARSSPTAADPSRPRPGCSSSSWSSRSGCDGSGSWAWRPPATE